MHVAAPASSDRQTLKARRAAGHRRRKEVPHEAHATWDSDLRRHKPLDLLRHSLHGRLPHLLPIRYKLMAASPFGFFRGAIPVMAYDLSLQPHSGILTQLCGDAHVRNLGAYAGIDSKLVFDINDFDETIRGPFEWDLKRLATSVLLAADAAGAKSSVATECGTRLLKRYRKSIRLFAEMPALDLARFPVRRLSKLPVLNAIFSKAERSTPLHNLDVLTEDTPQSPDPDHEHLQRQFRSDPPLLERVTGSHRQAVLDALLDYRKSLQPERRHLLDQYRPLDVAFKVVGTGSVGLRDFCILLEGNGPGDPLFLQMKEEAPSAWLPYLPDAPTSTHQGRRVVNGQRAMQLQSDPFLGWTTIDGRDFLVRQLNDHKGALDLDAVAPEELIAFADLAGELLARGHARAGDAAQLSGYIGKSSRFDNCILTFAHDYRKQTRKDWKALVRAGHL